MTGDAGHNLVAPVLLNLAEVMRICMEGARQGNEIQTFATHDLVGKMWIIEPLRHTDGHLVSHRLLDRCRVPHESTLGRLRTLDDHLETLIDAAGNIDEVDSCFRQQ